MCPDHAASGAFLQAGGKVAVLEKETFPRDKYCGACAHVNCAAQSFVHLCFGTHARCDTLRSLFHPPALSTMFLTWRAAPGSCAAAGDAVCTPAIHILREMGVMQARPPLTAPPRKPR